MGVITWLALVFTDLSIVFSSVNNIKPDVPSWLPGIILNLFILSLFYYYKLKIEKDEVFSFVDLLWRVFATGLIATVTSLALRLVEFLLNDTKLTTHIVFKDLIYLINLGLMVSFLLMAFSAWKRLILYQKSKWLLRLWAFFEFGLLATLLYNSFKVPLVEWLYGTLLGNFCSGWSGTFRQHEVGGIPELSPEMDVLIVAAADHFLPALHFLYE